MTPTQQHAQEAPALVSVCIPTYKGAGTIGATIESVLAQTYPHFEIIVVDDRSPDSTLDVVRAFADPRIRVVVNDSNLGAEGNWNRCIQLARGAYYKLLPHDDLLAPGCLAEQVAVLDADHQARIAMVFGWRQVINGSGRVLVRRGLPGVRRGPVPGPELVRRCVRAGTNLLGEPGNALVRTSTARLLARYDARQPYMIDLDFWFRALLHGDGHYTDTHSASFRISKTAWSWTIGSHQYADYTGFIARSEAVRRFGVAAIDRTLGAARARLGMLLRLMFYRFLST